MNDPRQPQISIYEVRAHFVSTGSSLNRWAKDRGVNPRQVQAAIRGDRKGPKARMLLEQVLSSVRGGA